MPATAQHRKMTANALKLVPEIPGPRCRLAEEFCLYPDLAFNAPQEFARYCRLPSGEWFHYLPDVSIICQMYLMPSYIATILSIILDTSVVPALSGTQIMTLRFPVFFIFWS